MLSDNGKAGGRTSTQVAVLAVVSLLVVSPILMFGMSYGWDLPHHYQCAMTFVESIRSGDLYPSWSLFRNFGYGGMETRLYPPISHYTLALAYLATSSWYAATIITLYIFTFLGSLGAYLWAREYSAPRYAVFAGAIFAILPYHLTQIYNSYFFAEYAGMSILPFTFYFISRLTRRLAGIDVAGLGIAFAALILTHLPLTVIGSFCFAAYSLCKLRSETLVKQLGMLSAGAALGLLSSSFFWMKVLQERHLLAKTLVYEDPWLDHRLHFLITPLQSYTGGVHLSVYESATLFYDLMLGCVILLAIAFMAPAISEGRERLKGISGLLLVFVSAVIFATPLSKPLWDNIGILQEVQFPWRWLAISSAAAAVIAGAGLERTLEWFRNSRRPAALIIFGCVSAIAAFSIFQIIRPAHFVSASQTDSMMAEFAEAEGFVFWWTTDTRREIFNDREKVISDGREVRVLKWEAAEKMIRVGDGDDPARVRVAVFHHPNWQVAAGGNLVRTSPDENGALSFELPANATDVTIRFVETPEVKAARAISLLAWIGIFLAAAAITAVDRISRNRLK